MTRSSLLVLAVCSAAALAADATYDVIPEKSAITFHGSSTLHDFDGSAKIAHGAVDLTPGQERGQVVIDATSMNTANESRDAKMHDEHLQSTAFPTISFTLARLKRGGNGVVAEGTWDMRGVSRTVSIPVTVPAADAADPRITASFPIDMRDWSIPVPSAALVIRVDPVVRVDVALALRPGASLTVAASADRRLAPTELVDQHGVKHQLDQLVRDRLVMLFTIDARVLAKRCDGLLSARLGTGRPLIRIVDVRGFSVDERPNLTARLVEATRSDGVTFLLDWDGTVAKQLALPPAQLLFLGFAGDGRLTGEVTGDRTGATLGKALELVGVRPVPPFTDEQVNPRTKGAR